MDDMAPLQVAHIQPSVAESVSSDVIGQRLGVKRSNVPLKGVYGWGMYIPKANWS